MKVLVTGGAGYVGGVSVDAILAAGHDVVVLDDLTTGHAAIVPPGAHLVRGTYGDEEAVQDILEDEGIDAILHCAARSLVGESVRDPGEVLPRQRRRRDRPARGGARRRGAARGVLAPRPPSTASRPPRPSARTRRSRPINTYGETKRTFEGALRWYGAAYGFRSVILRYFNVAGATERLGEVHRPETHLIPNALLRGRGRPAAHAVRRGLPDARRHADPRLHPRRGPRRRAPGGAGGDRSRRRRTGPPTAPRAADLQPRDVDGLLGARGAGRGGRAWSARPIPHTVGPRRAGDPPVLVASNERAREVLGWAPRRSTLDEMIGSAWAWRRAHPDGYGD